jgi:hypothetical protein
MTAVALVRAPFRPLEVLEGWDTQLLKQAAELIGYRPQAIAEAEQTRKRSLDENILARALERAEIEPFTVASVALYKAKMLKEAHRGESWAFTRYMHRSGRHRMEEGQTVVHAVGWPAWISLAITSAISTGLHFGGYCSWGWDEAARKSVQLTKYIDLSTVWHIVALPAAAVGVWGLLMYFRCKAANLIWAQWTCHQVHDTTLGHSDGYKAPIPAFAIARMLALKKELPEVTFSVEQLNAQRQDLNTEHREPLPPDPFLIATFRGISAYVDVWDEPRFEGRRTV